MCVCVCVCLQITLVPKARYENIHLSRACLHSFRAELRAGLREIFRQLDQGRNVAIAGIEDKFFKNALQALFVALGLQQVGSRLYSRTFMSPNRYAFAHPPPSLSHLPVALSRSLCRNQPNAQQQPFQQQLGDGSSGYFYDIGTDDVGLSQMLFPNDSESPTVVPF